MDFELLQRLVEAPGVPSREEAVREFVIEKMRPLVDDIAVDAMGNVIGYKKGLGGPRVMMAAHMDEIGFLVKHIDDKGFLRLQPLGGFDPRVLGAQRVTVHGASGDRFPGLLQIAARPPHLSTEEERSKAPKVTDLFVDVGMTSEQAKARIEIGDPVTLERSMMVLGGNIVSKALDNRIALYVMLEALRTINAHACEIYAVATVQEEIGVRGAVTSAFQVEPEIGIAIDVTLANDIPGQEERDYISYLGRGPALKIMDSSAISDPQIVKQFREVADRHSIPYQLEIAAGVGTDAGGFQRSRAGVRSFTLSIPCRYVHTVNETISVADLDNAIYLLTQYLEEAHIIGGNLRHWQVSEDDQAH
ncbi:MAG: M42 family metallopeptidase [bacterium]|jgi:endoglucanase